MVEEIRNAQSRSLKLLVYQLLVDRVSRNIMLREGAKKPNAMRAAGGGLALRTLGMGFGAALDPRLREL